MNSMNTHLDMAQFAGAAVAYESNKNLGEYSIDNNVGLKFGTVSQSLEGEGNYCGYNVYHFLDKIKAISSETEFFNDTIQEYSLKMRFATPREVEELEKAFILGNATHLDTNDATLEWTKLKVIAHKHFDSKLLFFKGWKDPESHVSNLPFELLSLIINKL